MRWGRRFAAAAAVWVVCCAVAAHVRAQGAEESEGKPDQAIEAYLEKLSLKRLLTEQLEQRMAATARDQRVPIAERLGKLYVELLGSANTAQERGVWEEKAKTLLTQVPEADSFELRLNLQKAVYMKAEEIAEKHRLRLASTAEVAESERMFRSLSSQFAEIAAKVHRRVDVLEKVEQTGEATEKVIEELADARRMRSLAFYYAGWSNVYLALLAKNEQAANDALRQFGWLLNAGSGKLATVDRVQPAMFQYEHVARAAMGSGLAASLRGSDTEALRWLDALGESDSTPQGVRDQLVSRRLIVLGAAKRWYDIELLIRRARRPDRPASAMEVRPLPTALARLLAVITLEADKHVAGEQIEKLAKIALGDLVANKEVGQVLDLVSRYGTAPLGDSGFIVNYVRALQAYEDARTAHKAAAKSEGDDDEPTRDAAAINQYRAAAGLFAAAMGQGDADEFKIEKVRAAVTHGRALYFAGLFVDAADRFAAAWEMAGKGASQKGAGATNTSGQSAGGEEALWLAVLALDKGAKAAPSKALSDRLNQTIALFLQTYPDSEKSPRLVLMQAAGGMLPDDDALKVLAGVPKDSPVYDASRRQVARILYTKFRTSRGAERDFAAQRFVAVGEEVLALDRKAAMDGKASEASVAADRAIVRARQLLDALLSVTAPDASRAEAVLQVLRGVATVNNVDLRSVEAELVYRELQVALLRGNESAAEQLAQKLTGGGLQDIGGQFASAAERLMYRFFATKWIPGLSDGDASAKTEQIVKYGSRVIDRMGASREVFKDPGVATLYATVAAAAAERWKTTGDTATRDLVTRLDGVLLQVQPRLEPSLRRLAEMSESAQDHKTALACWLKLLAAMQPSSKDWFEARYNSIRLLLKVDAAKARDAMAQHKLLYPDFGPEPWGPKMRGLEGEVGASAPVPSPQPSPQPGGAQGGGGG